MLLTTYSPTLSSIEITLTDRVICENLIKDLGLISKISPEVKAFFTEDNFKTDAKMQCMDYEYKIDSNTKIIINNQRIKFEYYETKPPHLRQILIKQIDHLFKNFVTIKKMSINALDSSSWLSILWTPVKSSKSHLMNSSFLTYYKFNFKEKTCKKGEPTPFTEISLIGLLPIKFENKLFLSRIKQFKESKNTNEKFINGKNSLFNKINNEIGQNSVFLQNLIVRENLD